MEWAPDADGVVVCRKDDTVAHEIAHIITGIGANMHNMGGNIMRAADPTGPNSFGEYDIPNRKVEDSDCIRLDEELGTPNYDAGGEEIHNGNEQCQVRVPGGGGTHCPATPILLDLGGRPGIWTTGVDDLVLFDGDGDGRKVEMTWSIGGWSQGFLARDLNGNAEVDNGTELFGNGTFLLGPGHQAEHGFEALAQYDEPANGGNGDGLIDAADTIWRDLRLWIDVNHDALTQSRELVSIREYNVVALELEYVETRKRDPAGNMHAYRGYYHRRTRLGGRWHVTRERMEDIIFIVPHD